MTRNASGAFVWAVAKGVEQIATGSDVSLSEAAHTAAAVALRNCGPMDNATHASLFQYAFRLGAQS